MSYNLIRCCTISFEIWDVACTGSGVSRHFHLRLRIADAACIWLAVLPSTGGELWLGGIVASGLVSVLQENNISSILAATSKPPVAKVLGCIECDDEDHRAQGSQALREIVSLAPVGKSWSPAETVLTNQVCR